MQKPKTEGRTVEAVKVWNPKAIIGELVGGAIVGRMETPYGPAWVIETEAGDRFRLPNHADLDRKIEAARLTEPEPWLEITYDGLDDDERGKLYQVIHFPKA